MKRVRELVKRTWVYVTAVTLIAGSSSAMSLFLGSDMAAKAEPNVVSVTEEVKTTPQPETLKTETAANYTVVDLSKTVHENKDAIIAKLSYKKDLTKEQIEAKANEIIAAQLPGDKDISAEQAAANAADMAVKAFGVDLNGYIAQANFLRSEVPNSDFWSIVFYPADASRNNEQQRFSDEYYITINSVSGTMESAYFSPAKDTEQANIDLNDPELKEKAVKSLAPLLPKEVSVVSTKVIPSAGVTVVCQLSNGSAYAVRIAGENKEARSFIFFQNGYDGSLEKTEPTKVRG